MDIMFSNLDFNRPLWRGIGFGLAVIVLGGMGYMIARALIGGILSLPVEPWGGAR